MSARVSMLPANPTRSLILDGYPVASSPLLDMAALLNHVQGMGAQVIPCYSPGQAITAGNTATFRFRSVPRYQTIQRVWTVGVRSSHATSAAGVQLAAPTGGSFTAYPSRGPVPRGAVTPLIYVETVSAQAAAEAELSLDVKATDVDMVVDSLGCWEMPRTALAIGGSEAGQDLELVRPGSAIMVGTGQHVGGLAAAMASARTTARRSGLVQWSIDGTITSAVAFTAGVYTSLWLLPQLILARKLYRTSTTGTVSARVWGWMSDATTACNIQFNTTSGGTGVYITSVPAAAASQTPQWWPVTGGAPGSFAVDCEDLTIADGRRSARYDDVQAQVKITSGAGKFYVSAVSVFEA